MENGKSVTRYHGTTPPRERAQAVSLPQIRDYYGETGRVTADWGDGKAAAPSLQGKLANGRDPMANPRKEILNESQSRALGVALAGLDEILCETESWIEGRQARGILYVETNDLSPHRQDALRARVEAARRILLEARDRFGLQPTRVRASSRVWSLCCAIRDTLGELGARHMKGYGALPLDLGRFLDNLSARLVEAVDRLAEAVRYAPQAARPRTGSGGDATVPETERRGP